MKNILRKILGRFFISKIRAVFPSRVQKQLTQKERKEIEERSGFYQTFIGKNELCFDVGANFGNRVSPLLNIGARVIAVEPQEICYAFLKKKFGKKITVIPKGLGESAGTAKFYLSDGPPMSSFSEEWIDSVKSGRFKDYKWDNDVMVEMTTLDLLIAEFGMPEFIKIDVEGYELEVLKGLTKAVKMVSFEYTVPEQSQRPILCIEQIEKSNKEIECNYSVGESMRMAKDEWLSSAEMKEHLLTEAFINTGFGDIYVRSKIAFQQRN